MRWWRGRTGREVCGDALDGVADVGGRVCKDVQKARRERRTLRGGQEGGSAGILVDLPGAEEAER